MAEIDWHISRLFSCSVFCLSALCLAEVDSCSCCVVRGTTCCARSNIPDGSFLVRIICLRRDAALALVHAHRSRAGSSRSKSADRIVLSLHLTKTCVRGSLGRLASICQRYLSLFIPRLVLGPSMFFLS